MQTFPMIEFLQTTFASIWAFMSEHAVFVIAVSSVLIAYATIESIVDQIKRSDS